MFLTRAFLTFVFENLSFSGSVITPEKEWGRPVFPTCLIYSIEFRSITVLNKAGFANPGLGKKPNWELLI